MKAAGLAKYLLIILVIFLAISAIKCWLRPPKVITEEVVVIDSVAVQTLQTEIVELKNKLKAKPKVITVYVTEHDTITTTDTLTVYPVGSQQMRRDYAFKSVSGKDSLELNVNTDLYAYVYTDMNNRFYYEDSLKVWLTDIKIYKHTEYRPPPEIGLYLMGGLGIAKYQQVVSGASISQTDVQPNLGFGYMKNNWGAYLLGAPNGGNIGITLNINSLLGGILH